MKENKKKELASGDEIVQIEDATPLQTYPNVPKTLKLVPLSSSEYWKAVSRKVDVGNLPSHRGQKRAKVDPSSHGKAPLIKSNPSPVESPVKVPSSEAPLSEAPPCPNLKSFEAPPVFASFTFIRSETLA